MAVPLDDDREDIVEIAIISAFITTRDGAMVLGKKPAEPSKAYIAENWSHDEIAGRIASSHKPTKADANDSDKSIDFV